MEVKKIADIVIVDKEKTRLDLLALDSAIEIVSSSSLVTESHKNEILEAFDSIKLSLENQQEYIELLEEIFEQEEEFILSNKDLNIYKSSILTDTITMNMNLDLFHDLVNAKKKLQSENVVEESSYYEIAFEVNGILAFTGEFLTYEAANKEIEKRFVGKENITNVRVVKKIEKRINVQE